MSTSPADTALAVIEMARNGQFAGLRERFAPPLRDMVTAGSLRAAWEGQLATHGAVTGVGVPRTASPGPA
jgi:hypothetical protein